MPQHSLECVQGNRWSYGMLDKSPVSGLGDGRAEGNEQGGGLPAPHNRLPASSSPVHWPFLLLLGEQDFLEMVAGR